MTKEQTATTLNENKKVAKQVSSQKASVEKDARIVTIDRFRGLAIFCMIVFQFMKRVPSLGILSRIAEHNENGIQIFKGTMLADLIAPMFFFAIALTYKLSYDRRVKLYGKAETIKHFVLRNLALIGIGTMLNLVSDIIGGEEFHTLAYVILGFTAVILVFFLLSQLFKIKSLRKHRKIVSKCALYLASVLGVVTMGIAVYDTLIKAGFITGDRYGYWLVLQSLGMAGLVALPIIIQNIKLKTVLSTLLLALYTVYYALFDGADKIVGDMTQGGFIGGFGWAIIIVFGSIFYELYTEKKKYGYALTASFVAVALTMYFTLSISKSGVKPDPTFIMMTIAISAIVYLLFDLFRNVKINFDVLAWWGKYPILLYLIEFSVLGLYKEIVPETMFKEANFAIAFGTTVIVTALLTTLVWYLNRKKRKINL